MEILNSIEYSGYEIFDSNCLDIADEVGNQNKFTRFFEYQFLKDSAKDLLPGELVTWVKPLGTVISTDSDT